MTATRIARWASIAAGVVGTAVGVIELYNHLIPDKPDEPPGRVSPKTDPPYPDQPQHPAEPQQPNLSPKAPKIVSPLELSGSITLSKRRGSLGVCLRINGFANGLPSSYAPVFHAWVPGSAIDIPMIIENDGSCKNGYSLRSDAPAISQGGTMRIFKNNQPLAWVNVGSFMVSGGEGCQDVGLVESFVINWVKGGNRENASTSGIPVNGGYGWVCKS
jgi:hypothetical protein